MYRSTAPPALHMVAFEPATAPLDEQRRVMRAAAEQAWEYIEDHYHEASGLVSALGTWSYVTTWDIASALAAYLDITRWSYINPDVNLHLLREPVSDWIAVDGTTWVGPEGIGHGRAAIHDLEGLVGSASASQVVQRHPPASGVRTGAE